MFRLKEPSAERGDCGWIGFLLEEKTERLLRKLTLDDGPVAIPEGAVKIGFWFRGLKGRDERHLSNTVMRKDRRGGERQLYGDVQRETCVRGVIEVEGIVDQEDNPVERMTDAVYDLLPGAVGLELYFAIKGREGSEEALGE